MGNIQQAQLYGSPTYTINGVPVTQAQFYAYGSGTPYTGTTSTAPPTTSTPPTPVPPDQVSTVTGIDPAEVAAATYGKIIPLWVGGQLRLGAHIIYGPTFRDSGGFRVCDFGVSFGMPANNIGTRTLMEIRLDGAKAWDVSGGYSYNPLVFRFYPGDETQAADPLVIAAYPAAPVAHRGQCCIFLEGIRIADFNYKVPFVSALIADTTDSADPEDGVNLGDALEQIAASPYVNLPSTDFITEGVSERVDAVIVAEKMAFMELINRYARLYLWDIVQTDRLKVIERGTVVPDLSLDLTTIMASEGSPPITVQRQQQPDVAKELDYSWIDPDRDYEINTVTIKRPRAPVPVTASSGKDTISLPSVHTVQEATAWATLRKFKDELARETISLTTSVYGYELEPGDVISVDAGFKTYILRVLETLRGANWTNQIKAEPVLRCALPVVAASPLDGLACVTGAWSMSRSLLSSYSGPFYSDAPAVTSDPHFANVVLLVIPEGVNGATGVSVASPDYSPSAHTLTASGTVQIDTSQFKFGTSSLLFSGASPAVDAADSADWTMLGAFTIEAWIRYASSSASAQVIVGQWSSSNQNAWVLDISPGATTQNAEIAVSTTGTSITHDVTVSGSDANYAPNTWIHLVGDRDSSDNLRLYIDGVMWGKKASASGMFSSTSALRIGCFYPLGNLPFAGWLDSLRITKGISRYGDVSGDSSFTPPTTEFPKS